MTRAARWALSAGVLLFVGLLLSQGLPAILATLSQAGWGLLLVAMFHLLPLVLDAAAISVLFEPGVSSFRDALLTRWAGESANSLMPAGQIGGPVLMARQLSQRGLSSQDAAAVITVSTTLQTFAQIAFALLGIALLGAHAGHVTAHTLRITSWIASLVLAAQVGGFYLLQRRGLFGKLMRTVGRVSGKRNWSQWLTQAQAIDAAVERTYRRSGPAIASFSWSLVGWLVGTGEVYLILLLLKHPVTWLDALLLESLGQAIRGAAFAIPGALGVQEGGYLLLAPLVGLSADAALALSLAKRTREIVLGIPGLLYVHFTARSYAQARPAPP
jgi:putative membrane protein